MLVLWLFVLHLPLLSPASSQHWWWSKPIFSGWFSWLVHSWVDGNSLVRLISQCGVRLYCLLWDGYCVESAFTECPQKFILTPQFLSFPPTSSLLWDPQQCPADSFPCSSQYWIVTTLGDSCSGSRSPSLPCVRLLGPRPCSIGCWGKRQLAGYASWDPRGGER